MSTTKRSYLIYFFAIVWFANGLICKVLNFVPRHNEIVKEVLQTSYSTEITYLIGALEILLSIWVLSLILYKICGMFQISIILIMNVLEFTFAPQLLLHGQLNFLFATIFCGVIYYEYFIRDKNPIA